MFWLYQGRAADERDREQRDRERRTQLSEADAAAWEDILRKLSTEKQSVKMAMVFALDHAEQAKSVVKYVFSLIALNWNMKFFTNRFESIVRSHSCAILFVGILLTWMASCSNCFSSDSMLIEAMTLSSTPIPKKLARLYLVSDILHNASTPVTRGASLYRSEYDCGFIFWIFLELILQRLSIVVSRAILCRHDYWLEWFFADCKLVWSKRSPACMSCSSTRLVDSQLKITRYR